MKTFLQTFCVLSLGGVCLAGFVGLLFLIGTYITTPWIGLTIFTLIIIIALSAGEALVKTLGDK